MATTEVQLVGKPEKKPLWQRLAWLLGIWTASVLALGTVSYLLRMFMTAAGLSTP
ncbi:DUF2474 domain-containing protein [Metapseudomonas boanensis]|uniref:DUF2474 domain-containing protein n=1 Tax=Metapseudomonas boanensis TaxID=2822138 RepID=A0ABS5XMZ4_9GAMM|nr:DUF2474 domain-containing protein [Pseudomonas boanensis]MBT8769045.1 DUF2474 domain-containing protein [Pseudomonas boanensis]